MRGRLSISTLRMWPAGTGLLAPVLVDSDTALFGLEGMLLWKHERFGFGLESLMGIRWSSYRCIPDLADPTLDDHGHMRCDATCCHNICATANNLYSSSEPLISIFSSYCLALIDSLAFSIICSDQAAGTHSSLDSRYFGSLGIFGL